jgi:esterase/lipase superfamily enzyme
MIHYIITNRQIEKKNGKEEISEGNQLASDEIRFATFDTDSKKIIVIPDIKIKSNRISAYHIKKNEINLKGSVLVFRDLYLAMAKKTVNNDLLVYIHGYANDMDTVRENLINAHKVFVSESGPIENIIAFAWPSNGNLLQYRDDKRDAEISGFALGRSLQKLQQFFEEFFKVSQNEPCYNNIHILCHSMGNFVLESMMKALIAQSTRLTTVFKEIVLVGADVDDNVFEEFLPFSRLTDICERVHIYYNKKDKALQISETTKNPFKRLGKYGPKKIINDLNVNIIDISATKPDRKHSLKDRFIHHWPHITTQSVIDDINAVFSGIHADKIKKRHKTSLQNYFRL